MDYIIVFKDRTFKLISKKQADDTYERWAANPTEFFYIDELRFTGSLIDRISDLASWLKSDNSRLRERGQLRCGNCLEVNRIGDRCSCKQKETMEQYEGLGMDGIVNLKRVDSKEPPKEELVRVINLLRNHFDWAKEWWDKKGKKGRTSVCNYAKIVWNTGYFYLESRGTKRIMTR